MPSDDKKKKKASRTTRRQRKEAGGGKGGGKNDEPGGGEEDEGGAAPVVQLAHKITFPPSLTPRQRAAIHETCENAGYPPEAHTSSGEGGARALTVVRPGLPDGEEVVVEGGEGGGGPLSDGELCRLMLARLDLVVAPQLAPGPKLNMSTPTLDEFVTATLPLIELEKEADVEAAEEGHKLAGPEGAQAKGRALLNLRVAGTGSGLLGKTLLTLESNKGIGNPLPAHKMTPHDVVGLRPNKGEVGGPPLATGVVYRVSDAAITVALDDPPEDGLDVPLRLEKLANEVTYQRLRKALVSLTTSEVRDGPAGPLLDVAFGRRAPRMAKSPPTFSPVNARLDPSQLGGVRLALSAGDVALIHGPPGTGKTTTVVEVVLQEVKRGSRVLVCSASNIAVDNLVERLDSMGGKELQVVRVGHPARLLESVLGCSLEARVLKSDNSALAQDCRRERREANAALNKLKPHERREKRELRGELRRLAKEERQRQQKAVEEVLAAAKVVCCTLTGALSRTMEPLQFDLVVIDEAAQALEAACWQALTKAPRAVLAGDHLQLPPTVTSKEAGRKGLGTTLFERLHAMYGRAISAMLTVQYRMNEGIMRWSSDELYGGLLTAAPSVAGHTLSGLPGGGGKRPKVGGGEEGGGDDGNTVLVLIDTAGCGMDEILPDGEGGSKANEGEAQVVWEHVRRLHQSGSVQPDSVGVITPYSAQVSLLRETRPPALAGVEVSTVDGFQGREKEAVVVSTVRSSPSGGVGFLADNRRMNVAITRARRHVALVGDTDTVSRDPFLARLVRYFEAHGDYRSGGEYCA